MGLDSPTRTIAELEAVITEWCSSARHPRGDSARHPRGERRRASCGVVLERRFGRAPCVEDESFGCVGDERGVWARAGCHGAFRCSGSATSFRCGSANPTLDELCACDPPLPYNYYAPSTSDANASDAIPTFGGAPLFVADEPSASQLLRRSYPFGLAPSPFRVAQCYRNQATRPPQTTFASCAVVGSSGVLKGGGLGGEIDGHEAVIRVNAAPVGGYEADVGHRTTWRVLASKAWALWRNTSAWSVATGTARDTGVRPHPEGGNRRRRPNDAGVALVVCDRPFLHECQRALLADAGGVAHAVSPNFYFEVRRHCGHSRIPLTGLVALALAMRSCATVDAYGFTHALDSHFTAHALFSTYY